MFYMTLAEGNFLHLKTGLFLRELSQSSEGTYLELDVRRTIRIELRCSLKLLEDFCVEKQSKRKTSG